MSLCDQALLHVSEIMFNLMEGCVAPRATNRCQGKLPLVLPEQVFLKILPFACQFHTMKFCQIFIFGVHPTRSSHKKRKHLATAESALALTSDELMSYESRESILENKIFFASCFANLVDLG